MKKISRKQAVHSFSVLSKSWYRKNWYGAKKYQWYILDAAEEVGPFRSRLPRLVKALIALCKKLEIDRLIFLPEYDVAWRYQNNDYPPVQAALDYLADSGVGKRFDGSIEVPISELRTFAKHFGWLVRCNASLPSINFSDPDEIYLLQFCRYGSLHALVQPGKVEKNFRKASTDAEFKSYQDCPVIARLPGRRIVV